MQKGEEPLTPVPLETYPAKSGGYAGCTEESPCLQPILRWCHSTACKLATAPATVPSPALAALAETTAVLDAVYRDKCAMALCEMCKINLAGILDRAENVLKAAKIEIKDLYHLKEGSRE